MLIFFVMKPKVFLFALALLAVYFFPSCQGSSDVFQETTPSVSEKSIASNLSSKHPLSSLDHKKISVLDKMMVMNSMGAKVATVNFHWGEDYFMDKFMIKLMNPKTNKMEDYDFVVHYQELSENYDVGTISMVMREGNHSSETLMKKYYPYARAHHSIFSYVFKDECFKGYNFKEVHRKDHNTISQAMYHKGYFLGSDNDFKMDYEFHDDKTLSYIGGHMTKPERSVKLHSFHASDKELLMNPFFGLHPFILSFINGFMGMSDMFCYDMHEMMEDDFCLKSCLLSSIFFNRASSSYQMRAKFLLSGDELTFKKCCEDMMGMVQNRVMKTSHMSGSFYPTSLCQTVKTHCKCSDGCPNMGSSMNTLSFGYTTLR